MEKEIAMSRRMAQMWNHAKTPAEYQKFFSSDLPSGTVDETLVVRFLESYLPKSQKTIVDLGIGSGREMSWMGKLENVSKIIGVDYSRSMLNFCKKQHYTHKYKLILSKDDLLCLKKLPDLVKECKSPVIFISLINSFGNFSPKERTIFLNNLKPLLKQNDLVILCVYKDLLPKTMAPLPGNLPFAAMLKSKTDKWRFRTICEYAKIPYVWHSTLEKNEFPTFWYDKPDNDIVIHVNGRRIVISHRFGKNEIKQLAAKTGLAVEKIITGKFMYVAILKNFRHKDTFHK